MYPNNKGAIKMKFCSKCGKEIADDGIIIKNRQPLDYRTETQWLEHGRIIKPGAKGKIMHATRHNLKTYVYFLEEQTEIMEVKND